MSDQEKSMRELSRNLFGHESTEPDPTKGNRVPGEGTVPGIKPNDEETTLEFVRNLFGHPGVELV